MYKLNSDQRQTQAQRLKKVDLRLVVGYLKTSIRFILAFPEGPLPFVVCGWRSAEEQAINYAKGRTTPGPIVTTKKPGESLHEQNPARALDIGFLNENGTVNYEEHYYSQFYQYWLEHSQEITWGGFWTSPHDTPHFQVPEAPKY